MTPFVKCLLVLAVCLIKILYSYFAFGECIVFKTIFSSLGHSADIMNRNAYKFPLDKKSLSVFHESTTKGIELAVQLCSFNMFMLVYINKRPKRSPDYQRLYTDFLSEWLIFVYIYQQPYHRINENRPWNRKAAS